MQRRDVLAFPLLVAGAVSLAERPALAVQGLTAGRIPGNCPGLHSVAVNIGIHEYV